jgi:putative hydrolase of the HAD superfamily
MKADIIKVVAFDADDTLWDCQGHFEVVMQHLYDELVPWVDRETAALELFATERKNMRLLGYGVKAFTLSMLETAMRVSRNEMPAEVISDILQRCYTLLEFPCTPLPEVEETLTALRTQWPGKRLVVFTKGELLDQQHKLERSGLTHFFDDVEITSDKGEKEFSELCRKQHVSPQEMLMVGNSLKSDIAPALAIGCQAVYIPFHVTWQLEHAEHFQHPQMVQIEHFSELLHVLGKGVK